MNDPKLIEACKRVIKSYSKIWSYFNNNGMGVSLPHYIRYAQNDIADLRDFINHPALAPDRLEWLRCANCLAWNGTGCEHWMDGWRRAEGRCMNWRCKRCHQGVGGCMYSISDNKSENILINHSKCKYLRED